MTDDERQLMHRELVHDLGEAARAAQARADQAEANRTLEWVRDRRWKHTPSDDFGGCVE